MKQFSWIRAIALLLVLIMCFGMAACGNTADDADSNESSGSSDNSDNGNGGKLTEQQLFAQVKAAADAWSAYDGAFAIDATRIQKRVLSADEVYEISLSSTYSVDKANNRYFRSISETYNEQSYLSTTKGFVLDGGFYVYNKDVSGEESTEDYTKYKDGKALMDSSDSDDIDSLFSQVAGGAFLAESFDELKKAFDTTYPQLLANGKASLKEEGELKDDATVTLTPTVTIKKSDDGSIVLSLESELTMSEMGSEDSVTKNVIGVLKRTFTVKDGKLSGICLVMKMSGEQPAENGNSMEKMEQEIILDYVIKHSFDEEGYNAISVSLPSDPNAIQEPSRNSYLYVSIGGGKSNYHINSAESTENCLNNLKSSVENRYFYGFAQSGTTTADPLTVKGFYKDAALTQKLEANISIDDLLALETIYADVEILDGYALVMYDYEEESKISRDYQIVACELFSSNMSRGREAQVVSINDTFFISSENPDGKDYKTLVNGVETSMKNLTLESKKTYLITHVTLIQDKDLGLEHVIDF